MASIGHDSRGKKRILFVDDDGSRKTVRLGRASERVAHAVKLHVESLLSCRRAGLSIDPETAAWLGQVGDEIHDRLARCGLVKPRSTMTLGEFLTTFIGGRVDKRNTRLNMESGAQRMREFFGDETPLKNITTESGQAFLVHLSAKYAPATVGRTIRRARQFYTAAIKRGLVKSNPFADVKAPDVSNRDRIVFIDAATAAKVMDACPGREWRLRFALARYAGLRIPSELDALMWQDIDWDDATITIRAHKTAERVIPLFAELRPYLEACRADLGPVVEKQAAMSYRQAMQRIIKRAGVPQWPRLFHNLRASRHTELEDRFPSHVVCYWMGNTTAVSRKHYLKANAGHYEEAARIAARKEAKPGETA